jgi:hypothetical protein
MLQARTLQPPLHLKQQRMRSLPRTQQQQQRGMQISSSRLRMQTMMMTKTCQALTMLAMTPQHLLLLQLQMQQMQLMTKVKQQCWSLHSSRARRASSRARVTLLLTTMTGGSLMTAMTLS